MVVEPPVRQPDGALGDDQSHWSHWGSDHRIRGRRQGHDLSFTFDDGNDTQYAALPVFARYGMHSTLYINTGLVGTRDIMTWSQLEDFADAGHELGGHTAHHTGLTEVSETKARAEIKADVDALQAHGFPARSRSRTPTVTGETRRQSGSGTRATPTHAPPTSIGSRIRS